MVSNSLFNNSQGPVPSTSRDGIGLKNLQQRYSMECGKNPEISITREGDKRFFEVGLPIIKSL